MTTPSSKMTVSRLPLARLGLISAVVAALAAAVATVITVARNRLTSRPAPAAAPPSLRAATNGKIPANHVTTVDDF